MKHGANSCLAKASEELTISRRKTSGNVAAGFLGSVEYFNGATKGKSDKANWVLSAVLDELQRVPTTSELNTWESMLQ